MRWTLGLSEYLAQLIFVEWKKADLVDWKVSEEEVASQIHQILSADLSKKKS